MPNLDNHREGEQTQEKTSKIELDIEGIEKYLLETLSGDVEYKEELNLSPKLKEVFDKLTSTRKVKGIIKDLLEEFDERQLLILALSLAKEKPGLVGEYLEYFKQSDKKGILLIAKTMAYSDGAWLMQYFEKFPIEEEEKIFDLVMIMLDKTEDEYKKELIAAGEEDEIAEMVSGEVQFAVYQKVCEYFDKLNITSPEYINQIQDKIKKFDENLYQKYEGKIVS